MESLADEELVACFYGGSDRAFELLSGRWWRRLLGYFRRLGFADMDAEDLVQETMLKLYQTRDTSGFDCGKALRPFLFTVARNQAVQVWRKRASAPPTDPLALAESIVIETDEPPAIVADLFGCIWTLPEIEQSYILLCGKHGLGELSHLEIGDLMGKWPAQMTQVSQRARERLRVCLTAKGYR